MKILHTSDLHLGLVFYEHQIYEEQLEMIHEIINAVNSQNADVVIIAGDVFDKAIVYQRALSLYDELITRLSSELHIPVLICAGNHDSAERLTLCSRILSKNNIYIEGKLQSEITPVNIDDCSFWFVPHFNLDTARSIYPDETFDSYNSAYRFVCDRIRDKFLPNRKNILIGHCFVSGGCLSESDRGARLGGAELVSTDVFEGFDYVALGHLHAPHNITPTIRYSGSPYCYSFGEAGKIKSVTIFDTDTKAITEISVPHSRGLRVLEGTYLELLDTAEKDNNKDDYMKIVLKDKYPTGDIYDIFKKHYENILSFEGMTIKSESTLSTLTAKEIVKLSPVELLKDYYSNKTDASLGDFELEWFSRALEAVRGKEDA